jgi:diaminopropionate ammonia-lyase
VRGLVNAAVRRDNAFGGLFTIDDYAAVDEFYQSRAALTPTPLHTLPSLAATLGVGSVELKDESGRFGLSAFKSLGAFYTMHRLGRPALEAGVVCATAGNHGRAVARGARDLEVRCTVFVPAISPDAADEERAVRDSRVDGMRSDGAEVIDVAGAYEAAVQRAAAFAASSGAMVISDTSWPGYEDIPRDIMAGYTRLFTEAAAQWRTPPGLVVVQAGVGGLLCAAASWLAFRCGPDRPFLIGCEPDGAACLLESARAGRAVRLSSARTMMAGLRCAEPSHAAWPTVRDGVDAFVAIPDTRAREAMHRLARVDGGETPIAAGPSGACGIAALMALASEPILRDVRDACSLGPSTRVLAVVTEGK